MLLSATRSGFDGRLRSGRRGGGGEGGAFEACGMKLSNADLTGANYEAIRLEVEDEDIARINLDKMKPILADLVEQLQVADAACQTALGSDPIAR